MEKTIFNYPTGFFWFCSGWHDEFEPDGRYSITRRRKVSLKEEEAQFTKTSTLNYSIPQLLLKNKESNITGLSSGAGSSLFEHSGNIFKIKRNGFFNDKYTFQPFLDSGIDADLENVIESSIMLNYRGVLTPERAEREIKALDVLKREGLCDAYEPLGFFLYELPSQLSEHDNAIAGASLMAVNSDIRIDEFVFALLSDMLYKSIDEGYLKYDHSNHVFLANDFPVSSFFKEFKTQYSEIFYDIGKSIGSFYKEFHNNGHLRGYLNAWFGNEVVNPDGSLSLIDLDFSIMNPKFSKEDIKELQKLEYSQARGSFSSEFESMFLHSFALVGYYLGKGFDNGYYCSSNPINIPQEYVNKAVQNIKKYSKEMFGGE